MGLRKNGKTVGYTLKRILFLLPAVILLVSCGGKRPDGILSRHEMVQVMEELYIAEEKLNYLSLSRDSAKQVFRELSARIFADAAVSDSIFRRSFDYYMERPREMELIYTALVDTLQLREQRTPYRPDQQ